MVDDTTGQGRIVDNQLTASTRFLFPYRTYNKLVIALRDGKPSSPVPRNFLPGLGYPLLPTDSVHPVNSRAV
jgi:hypothetical protein